MTEKNNHATIKTRLGEIQITLLPEIAPGHVANFLTLAGKKLYDETTFHRVIPGFMIQGGDPNTRLHKENRSAHGMGGPGYTINAEFSKKSHKRGIVSMARAANPNSAGSQFFICVADAPFLDGQYTVFGEVSSGMEIADIIVNLPRDGKDNPHERIEMEVIVPA
jgi:peptidyl-prolyl cis-trans isomerase B (cyclophilin B)